MSYLDKTVDEMKGKIMLFHKYLKDAKTEDEVGRYTKRLEEYIRGKLLESFKNGIEVGGKGSAFLRAIGAMADELDLCCPYG